MNLFERLRKNRNQYDILGLKENPFSISPLFRNFRDKNICEREEPLFVLTTEQEEIFQILPVLKDKRTLVYGLFGVGKTSFIDAILYSAYHFHNRFCVRTIITEDNVSKAINELLLSLCYDLLWEISHREFLKPFQSIKKWLAEKQYKDVLFEYLLRLAGSYTEKYEDNQSRKRKIGANLSFPVGIQMEWDKQKEWRKSLQSYVEVLPMKNVADYMADFSEIISKLGFKDIIIFIDEADHLGKIDEFLRFLTKSREVLFADRYTFFVAGSESVAKYTETMGSIFDKLIFLKPTDQKTFEQILTARLRFKHPSIELTKIFEKEALDFIFENSGGVSKFFLRMAENALDVAAVKQCTTVTLKHCLETLDIGKNKITAMLSTTDIKILRYLAKQGAQSPSEESFQKEAEIKRVALRNQLEKLAKDGYTRKERQGKKYLYSIASPFKKYFESEER